MSPFTQSLSITTRSGQSAIFTLKELIKQGVGEHTWGKVLTVSTVVRSGDGPLPSVENDASVSMFQCLINILPKY